MTGVRYTPPVAQAATRDRLLGEGYKAAGVREYPTKLKRTPVETVLVMVKDTFHPRGYSSRTVIVNAKGGVE